MKHFLFIIAFAMICTPTAVYSEVKDHDLTHPGKGTGRGSVLDNQQEDNAGCSVTSGELTQIANGESDRIESVVTYLTAPSCIQNSQNIAKGAIAKGIEFNQMPFKLVDAAKNFSSASISGIQKLDADLVRRVPPVMEEHPMTAEEQLPLIAQFSVLSRSTGIWALSNLIKQELVKGSELPQKDVVIQELAKNVIRMGATEPLVAKQLSETVEEMAVLSQADALGRMLSTMALAANVEGKLSPAFNQMAVAFNRGVQKVNGKAEPERNLTMIGTTVEGIKNAVLGNRGIESGVSELNEAFGILIQGKKVELPKLKKVWREVLRALTLSPLLPNIAEAVAASLTPEFVYLDKKDLGFLYGASKNYPEIAYAVQNAWLMLWANVRRDLAEGSITAEEFNAFKRSHLEPVVAEVFEFEPEFLSQQWVRTVTHARLVSEAIVEKRFPRLVVSLIKKREETFKGEKSGFYTQMQNMATNFGILYFLSDVHIRTLREWVRANEN